MPLSSAELIDDPIGCYPPATVACFDPTRGELPRRQLDERRTLTFLDRLATAGVPAALIASSTGQGHLRTVDDCIAAMADKIMMGCQQLSEKIGGAGRGRKRINQGFCKSGSKGKKKDQQSRLKNQRFLRIRIRGFEGPREKPNQESKR